MTECIVCLQITDKYKCPKCFDAYCSLDCYKHHKDSPACIEKLQQKKEVEIAKGQSIEHEPTVHEPFKTEDFVAQDKLRKLDLSDDLKNLLYNPHLRSLLHEIDTAPNAWKAIQAAMHEPLFLEFADVCLNIIEPTNESDNV